MNGFLNFLKPPGMTSSDAVAFVRRKLPRGTRVGHGGTLDPDAAGVLPICVGRAARLFDYLIDKRKTYLAELSLGEETDTQDASGLLVRARPVRCARADVERALPTFIGDILQVPPAYSAIQRGGKRMYDLARRGEAVALEARPARVDSIDCVGETAPNRYLLRVSCGKGVYIRTLCHDIGAALGCGAHMSFLLREKAGPYAVEEALTPEAVAEAASLEPLLRPMDEPLDALGFLRVSASREAAVRNGNPIDARWIEEIDEKGGDGAPLRVYLGARFAGIARRGGAGPYRFSCMLLEAANGE